MKTLSKVLSMLLVIVMCVSLFAVSAYAADDYLVPLDEGSSKKSESGLKVIDDDDEYPSSKSSSNESDTLMTLDVDDDLSVASATDIVWKIGSTGYETLAEAVSAASAGATITLAQNTGLTSSVTIVEKLTIDLNGKTLTISEPLNAAANVTIENGTIENSDNIASVSHGATVTLTNVTATSASFDIQDDDSDAVITSGTFYEKPDSKYIASGYTTVTDTDKDGNTVYVVTAEEDTYIAYIGDTGYATANEAFAAAENGDTITFVESDEVANIKASTLPSKDVTIKLGSTNCLELTQDVEITNADVTIKGYKVDTKTYSITLSGSSLTLGSGTDVEGAIAVSSSDSSLTVNGGEVGGVEMTAGTLTMEDGTIKSLTVNGDVTLDVSGGTVEDLLYESGDATRAITGGEWTMGDEDLDYFKSSIADGYETKQTESPYTVTKKGSSSDDDDDDNSGSDGDFEYDWNTSSYTIDSGDTVYVRISDKSENGYWIGKKFNASGATKLDSSDYTLKSSVSGDYNYKLTLDNDYLDDLSAGTYYFFVVYDGDTTRMGSLTISKSGSVSVDDGVEVHPRYDDTWYYGDSVLQFYMSPYPSDKKVTVRIDGEKISGYDWYDYNTGIFYLGKDLLTSLETGSHTLTVETKDGSGSCTFYVEGATLTPVDTTKHVINSSKNLQYVCSEPIAKVYVNGKLVDEYDDQTNYKLSSDGKTLTLTAAFLNDRTAGNTYTLSVETEDGDIAESSFTILTTAQASSSPQTGDTSNIALWVSALVMSGIAAALVIPKLMKKKNELM